jgi:F-type H+-transporting ATPase subunit a
MHEIRRQVLLKLPSIGGLDLSVTNEVILLWLAAGLAFVVIALACRRRGPVARGWFQNLFEALIEIVDRQIVRESLGERGRTWSSFLLALFFFVLFGNLLGMVPLPSHVKAATSSLTVTSALAAVVFGVVIVLNVRRHGLWGFFKRFVPRGIPWPIAVMAAPIEVVSWLAKPVSLAIRLFANMMAGHALILVFVALAAQSAWFVAALPLAGAVLMSGFELFVCFLQAFIFTMLAGLYIRDALETAH